MSNSTGPCLLRVPLAEILEYVAFPEHRLDVVTVAQLWSANGQRVAVRCSVDDVEDGWMAYV